MSNKAYASKQYFGTQRASAGRDVLVNVGTSGLGFVTGKIVGIDPETDQPIIHVLGAQGFECGLEFAQNITHEEHVGNMPPNSWAWPPRLESALSAAKGQPLREGLTVEGTPNGRFA